MLEVMTGTRARVSGILVLAALGCGRPPLRVQALAEGFRVDVQTLGEYQTTVKHIRLTCAGDVVWDVKASNPSPQIHYFTIRTGTNPCYPGDVGEPEYRVVVPDHCQGFRVESGAQCQLEVWGGDSALSRAETTLHFR